MRLQISEDQLQTMAYENRRLMLDVIYRVKSGHQGGSLSAMDILTALYFNVLNIDEDRPDWPDRDRLVVSKGHASVGYYTVLAKRGFFPIEELDTYSMLGSRLQGHPDMCKTPGVDYTTGSLGQGFSAAIGMALGAKKSGRSYLTYTLLGDGELNEGQVWEGLMFAAKYKLDNLIAIVDYNRLQCTGPTAETMPLEPLANKFSDFNWRVLRTNGHKMNEILTTVKAAQEPTGKPTVIIADTVKGKGVRFMENRYEWHAKVFTDETYHQAVNDLYKEVWK